MNGDNSCPRFAFLQKKLRAAYLVAFLICRVITCTDVVDLILPMARSETF